MIASSRDRLVEWVSYNLALNVSEHRVKETLRQEGVSSVEATRMIQQVLASPLYRACSRLGSEVTNWTKLSDALLEIESEVVDYRRVPRVSQLSSERFLLDFYALNRPVIIEDVVGKWPAIKKWSLPFLQANYGSESVQYQRGRSNLDFRDSFVDHSVSGTFDEYISLVQSSEATNSLYLIAHDRLLDHEGFRPLLDDIDFDQRYFDAVGLEGRVFFWLGPAGTVTPMHRDLGNVYLAQVSGRKSVKMVPSKQMHLVYNETGYHSDVDFENFSMEDYPRLKLAHIVEEIINPGELLFIPLGWWHHIKALDQSITITGNNFRFKNAFTPIF